MKQSRSMVLSMRLPVESGKRLKRIANRHGWTPSDASARLVEEASGGRNLPSWIFAIHQRAGKPTYKEAPWRYGKSCSFFEVTKEMLRA